MSEYKWADPGQTMLFRHADGAYIPWPPVESQGEAAAAWMAAGNLPDPADPRPQPSYAERRAAAYVAEADPLFFQEQRGEVAAGTWAARVAEIKSRFPKPA